MFEPRDYESWRGRPNLRFIGGVPAFDLWYRDDQEANRDYEVIRNADVLPYLRVAVISGRVNSMPLRNDWDEFRLPLHLNPEINLSMHPEERKLKGRWGDIHLSLAQVNEIETYLRCFAPWVLGDTLTGKEDSNADT